MKRSAPSRRGIPDSVMPAAPQPDRVGWVRKFCGRGMFRELWRNRFVVLRGDHLYISEKEVRDERRAQEVFDLADYERSEELRKAKSRSKKNHSRFTVLRRRQPGNTVPNLVFLAVSPEEKELWVNALNAAIIKAKNRILDEVTLEEDSMLVHPTRDRAKIPQGRRLPTRGHLLAVASTSSHGMLTLDLVAEEDGCLPDCVGGSQDSWENGVHVDLQRGGSFGQVAGVRPRAGGVRQRAETDASKLRALPKETKVKTGSLPRGSERSWGKQPHLEANTGPMSQRVEVLPAQSQTPQPGKRLSVQGRSRCASMDGVLSCRPAMIRSELRSALRRCPTEEESGVGAPVPPVGQLQSLIAQRMQRAQELLEEMRLQELQKAKAERERGGGSPYLKSVDSPRLQQLRSTDSPHSRSSGSPRSRSSDSPRLRGKDSPRLRGRESPRSKAKRSRSKGAESPRSRGAQSPAAKTNDSPQAKHSPRPSVQGSGHSPKLGRDEGAPAQRTSDPPCSTSSQVTGLVSIGDGDSCLQINSEEVQGISPSLSGSFDSTHPRTPDTHCVTPPTPPPPPSLPTEEEELDVADRRAEAERLLEEALSSWKEAQEVLQEVKELQSQTLRRQRRRTYEKMTTAADEAASPPEGAEEDDLLTSPTSPEEDG